MQASLRALLTGLIDYAGLFPPAGLPLDEAVRNYARYRTEPEAWMLGRFICPAARLEELALAVRNLAPSGPPLALSVLVGKGNGLVEMFVSVQDDLHALTSIQAGHGERLKVEVLEIRLPAAAVEDKVELSTGFLIMVHEFIDSQARGFVTPYFEIPWGSDWRGQVRRVVGALAAATVSSGMAGHVFCHPAGLKLRCGGLAASAFPAPAQVAFVIAQCRDRLISLKATAGLHHPFRRFDPGLQTPMHGFINVFGAAVLAHARRLTEEQVRQIIEDEDAGHFVFDDQGFRWQDVRATTAEISAARDFATSFGSCSFDEPRDDLRALGWL